MEILGDIAHHLPAWITVASASLAIAGQAHAAFPAANPGSHAGAQRWLISCRFDFALRARVQVQMRPSVRASQRASPGVGAPRRLRRLRLKLCTARVDVDDDPLAPSCLSLQDVGLLQSRTGADCGRLEEILLSRNATGPRRAPNSSSANLRTRNAMCVKTSVLLIDARSSLLASLSARFRVRVHLARLIGGLCCGVWCVARRCRQDPGRQEEEGLGASGTVDCRTIHGSRRVQRPGVPPGAP